MITTTKEFNGYVLVEIGIAEANLSEAERFKTEMVRLIDQGEPHYIVSFENVEYVDSSFLGALVSSLKYAMSKDSDIAVVNLNKDIHNLFKLIRMDKVFKIYPTLPELV